MALAIDATSSIGSEQLNKTTYSWNHTTAASAVLFVSVHVETLADPGTPTVSYNSSNLTAIGSPVYQNNCWVQWYYHLSPASGTHSVTIAFSSGPARQFGSAISFTGADTTTQPDSSNTGFINATVGSHALTVSTTAVANNVYLIFAATQTGTAAQTDGASQTAIASVIGNSGYYSAYKGTVNAGSQSGSVTYSTTNSASGTSVTVNPAIAATNISVSDSSTVTESTTPLEIHNANVFDSSAVTESITLLLKGNISVFDSSTVTESISVILTIPGLVLNDSSTVTDVPTIGFTNFVSVFDSSGVTESTIVDTFIPVDETLEGNWIIGVKIWNP